MSLLTMSGLKSAIYFFNLYLFCFSFLYFLFLPFCGVLEHFFYFLEIINFDLAIVFFSVSLCIVFLQGVVMVILDIT